MSIEGFQSLVRPIVTVGLVGAQVGIAALWSVESTEGVEQAFAALAPFTMMVVTFWFKDRANG